MLDITPMLIRFICAFKNWSIADFYYSMGIDKHCQISYFYKILQGVKPLHNSMRTILNNSIQESLTTEELIKVIKVQDCFK